MIDTSGINCTHGVALDIDRDHSCFECEKEAMAGGLPITVRILGPEGIKQLQGRGTVEGPRPAPGTEAPRSTLASLMAKPGRLRGLEALMRDIMAQGAPTDINGDIDDVMVCPHEAELAERGAELKALQRVLLSVREELAQVTDDRDAFARENFDYVRQLDVMRAQVAAGRRALKELAETKVKLARLGKFVMGLTDGI